jgi:hypothetical protein
MRVAPKPERADGVDSLPEPRREAVLVAADRAEATSGRFVPGRPRVEAAKLGIDGTPLRSADRVDQLVVAKRQHVRDPAPPAERPRDPRAERREQRAAAKASLAGGQTAAASRSAGDVSR